MKTVILAEKPSQALAYAQSLEKSEKKDGYFVVKDRLFPDNTIITFGFGHLVELAPPQAYSDKWNKWSLEALPIFPENYLFQVPKDKKKQFKIVSKLLKEADTIIIATDSDREGSNIAWSIIHEAKAYNSDKTFKRLWINSLEREAIREGFANLKDGVEDIPSYQEAQTRQISDWLIGMNGSPLYSLSLQKKGISEVFSLGRVQTPTLYLIYKRNKEINEFKKTPFFDLESLIRTQSGTFKAILAPYKRFDTQEEAETYITSSNCSIEKQQGEIKNVEIKTKKKTSPLLFSLSNLQSTINKMYKASASDTLKAVQGLYEAKLLTYPRTDTSHITDNEFTYLKTNLSKYLSFLGIEEEPTQLEPRKRYVDNSKVQEHHAIILTKQVPSNETYGKLTDLQQKIYDLVAKTTVAMFLPDYQYEETVVDVQAGSLIFKAKGQVPLVQGWQTLFNSKSSNDKEEQAPILPKVEKGDTVEADIQIAQKETTPPKYFTEGTLLTAMKTAGKTVDDEEAMEILKEVEGIGTEATRASIIDSLKSRKYIFLKSNKLMITEKGIILCQAVENQPLLTSAEMTAKWETYLKKIGKRQGTQEAFLNNIKKFINHLLENVPGDIETLDISGYEKQKKETETKNTIGACPKCGGNVILKKNFYGCSNYPDCNFVLSDNFRKKKLSKTNLKELIDKGETVVNKVKKKDSKDTYNALVKLNEKGFIEFVSFKK